MPSFQQFAYPIIFAQMTTSERDATWPSPLDNLVIHNVSTDTIQVYDDLAGVWLDIATVTDLTDHEAAADPHTGYRLESADHSHQSTGAQAGKLDHGLALDGLLDDDHTQYQKESEKDAASGYAGLTAGTKLNLAQMQEVMAHADLTDSPADAHHAQAHGPPQHTEGTAWRQAYYNSLGDETLLALPAGPSASAGHSYYRSTGASSAPEFKQEMKTVSITVEDPTATEDIAIIHFFQAVTIREIEAVLVGSATPSVTINPKHSTDRSAAGNAVLNAATAITNTTTGQNLTSFTDPTIPVDSFLWLETTAQSGTVDELHLTFRYTVD